MVSGQGGGGGAASGPCAGGEFGRGRGDVAGALRMSEQVKEYTFLVKDDRAKEGRRVANTEHVAIPDQKHGVSEPYR